MRSFDIVHIAQTQFPDDPRPRREALAAAATGARVAVIALRDGADTRPVSRFGPLTVIRLRAERRRLGIATYLFDYGNFLARARWLIKHHPRLRQAQIIHVHSLPDFLVAAAGPARRRGARVILDLHEIFPELMRAKHPTPLGRAAARLVAVVEGWSRRRADVVITVTRDTEAILRARPARAQERLVIIHNLPDPADFGPPLPPRVRQGAPLRLVYHGTLTHRYGLDVGIAALAAARAQGADFELDIFGRGQGREALQRQVMNAGMQDHVRILPEAPASTLRDALPDYDAGFQPMRLDAQTRHSLPTKLLECIHLGLPVLTTRIPSYETYLPEDAGWFFTPGDVHAATDALLMFAAAAPAERLRRAMIAHDALAHLTWPCEAERLQELYHELQAGSAEDRQQQAKAGARRA
ncbi:MAG TPA: glycosyltransferase [Gemmatimonadales bacterium]|jgi:glycosyltransferase involved in cell wall biosynthesis|nr:glycosyltransferase [Gemmatimonadales bacterium]HET9603923.1 glycosyltransferase [Gemmatimonadales bacterium]